MPFVFGLVRSGSMGQRMFIGMLIGLALHFVSSSLSDVGEVYRLSPILTEMSPGLLVLAFGLWLLRRTN